MPIGTGKERRVMRKPHKSDREQKNTSANNMKLEPKHKGQVILSSHEWNLKVHSFDEKPNQKQGRRQNDSTSTSKTARHRDAGKKPGHRRFNNNNHPYHRQHHRASPPETIEPFALFCAFHLGICADGRYRMQNMKEIARRFGCTPEDVRNYLIQFGIDTQSVTHSGYDINLAQYDIRVAPEGIDRKELAKQIYEDFLIAAQKEREARFNSKTDNHSQVYSKYFPKRFPEKD